MAKFNVGDRVKLVKAPGMAASEGATATVTNCDHTYVWVKWDDTDLRNGQCHGDYSADNFEVATLVLKVGDKVRAIKEHDGELPHGIGEVASFGKYSTSIMFPEWKEGHGDGWHYWNYSEKCYHKLVLVEDVKPEPVLTLNREQVIGLCKLLSNAGKKINAIKYWRQFSGVSLREAKDFIDNGCQEPKPIAVGDKVIDGFEDQAIVLAISDDDVWLRDANSGQKYTTMLSGLKRAA